MLEQSREQKQKLKALSAELESVRQRLTASEDQARKPSPLLLNLQKEMAEVKVG